MTSLSIFVLSHDLELLAAVPARPELRRVHLTDLGLEGETADNTLAESRFFLSSRALDVTTEYVGVVSARYDEKFVPRGLVTLEQLAQGVITPFLTPRRVFAPAITGRDGEWVERSEAIHPGMTLLVREASELIPDVDLSRRTLFANSFIAHRDVYQEFVADFRALFATFHERYGLEFPHTYRCSHCGTELDCGHGRYQRDRHPSYFLERITALWFSQPRFDVIGLQRTNFMTGPRFARVVWRSARGQVGRYRRDRIR